MGRVSHRIGHLRCGDRSPDVRPRLGWWCGVSGGPEGAGAVVRAGFSRSKKVTNSTYYVADAVRTSRPVRGIASAVMLGSRTGPRVPERDDSRCASVAEALEIRAHGQKGSPGARGMRTPAARRPPRRPAAWRRLGGATAAAQPCLLAGSRCATLAPPARRRRRD